MSGAEGGCWESGLKGLVIEPARGDDSVGRDRDAGVGVREAGHGREP